MSDTAVFLFHREFRLYDNTGLNAIARSGKRIIPVFIFTNVQIDPKRNKYFSNGSVQFMCESLSELDQDIRKLGSKMIFMHGDTVKTLDKLHKKLKFSSLYSHEDNTPFADKRDAAVRRWADSRGVSWNHLEDYDLYSYRDGLREGKVYQKFTPYYNYCLKNLKVRPVDNFKLTKLHFVPASKLSVPGSMDGKQIHKYYEQNPTLFEHGGRKNGLQRLENLKNMSRYDDTRNDINNDKGTSHLSGTVKFGLVSIREVYWRLQELFGKHHGLIRELIWRSFYAKIGKYTDVLKGNNFNRAYDKVEWNWSKKDLNRWATAKTGIPLCDASMVALKHQSYLHNRLRMVVAMFATKDLLLHWSLPERIFGSMLYDFDPSSNNGGWQWPTSGADSAPYFRSFSYKRQGERFDPDAKYIKRWIPALKDVPAKDIHDWENSWEKYRNKVNYPKPMIRHREASEKAKKIIAAGLYRKQNDIKH